MAIRIRSALSAVIMWTLALGACIAGLGAQEARAQGWPVRPVRFILPFGAGSGIDVGARLLADKLSQRWGQPVIIENRPGGDGILAMTVFLNANDDHVLLFASSGSYTVHPYQVEKLPYDLKRDVMPIARVANTIIVASVPSKSGITSLKDFMALARAQPGKLNAAAAQGITEYALDGFLKSEGLDIQKVPYKDIVQAVPDLVEGRLNILFTSYAVVRPSLDGGGVRVLATGSRERAPSLPGIPTAVEAGVPSLQVDGLSGLFGPARMPLDVRKRIGADVVEAMKDPVLLERLAASGQTPLPGGAEDLERSVQMQIDQVDGIANVLGMKKKN